MTVPTDTPALLPPDPSVPGSYWIARRGDGFCDMWDWLPDDREWWRRTDDGDVCSPEETGRLGYTLATPHPIPGPAALEAVWQALAIMEKEAERLTTAMRNDFDSGVQSGMDSAAAHLRAAVARVRGGVTREHVPL